MAYLTRKLGEWYCEAPRPVRKQPAIDADEPARQLPTTTRRQPRPMSPLVEVTAVGWYSSSKAFRQVDSGSKPGEHRSERRTGTAAAPCPGCIAPYLEADHNRKALIEP
jgi:hypothetical protein